MAIKHNKVATVPDDGISEVGTDEWNDNHTIEDNTITNDHLTGSIAQSKVTNLTTDLSSKAPLNSPVLVTPNIGTPSAGTLTNCTGLPATTGLTATGTKSSSTYLRGDDTWSQISGIPAGVILMWSGTLASIPAGWNLCDGNNGTPNLIAKFVRSIATASTEAGSTGGSDSVTLTGAQSGTSAHGHSGSGSTNSTGSHNHALGQTTNSNAQGGNKYYNTATYGRVDLGKYTESNGTLSHTVSLSVSNASEANASSSHENRPAYFELAYIMKA